MLRHTRIVPTVAAQDIGRARTYYKDVLGLPIIGQTEEGTMFGCGEDSWLLLYETKFAGTNEATYALWDVDDLEAEMTELRGRGVVFEEYDMPRVRTVDGVAVIEGERAAWFKDSEGNILALLQRQ
jgi:catechol 2,3-dioxygenase-like lactoylglutathione lyase family enzyme